MDNKTQDQIKDRHTNINKDEQKDNQMVKYINRQIDNWNKLQFIRQMDG